MRELSTLFMDESGKASLAEQEDRPFLLTGAVLRNSEISTVEGFFRYIKSKYKLPLDNTFHSYDIYENPETKLKDEELLALSISLAEFLSLIPVNIYLRYTSKKDFKSALGLKSNDEFKGDSKRKEIKDYPYRVLASEIFSRFAEGLKREDCYGQIVADSRKGGDHQLLKTLHLCKEKHVPCYDDNIRERVTAISFAEKSYLSGGLEIADLVSFVSFFRVRRKLSEVEALGIPQIWEVVKEKAEISKIKQTDVRKFFDLKKGEVHKYLK